MPCPICQKRMPERFCPAKGETICAVCCGTEREVTIDCPTGCIYLRRARRQEAANRQPPAWKELPLSDVRIPPDLVHDRQDLVSGLGASLLDFALRNSATHDSDVLDALAALAETYRTLTSGLYYEQPPQGGLPRELYAHLAQWLESFKKENAGAAGIPPVKVGEIFYMLVFFLRLAKARSNGRPRGRAFLDFLRAQFPEPAAAKAESSRIVLP